MRYASAGLAVILTGALSLVPPEVAAQRTCSDFTLTVFEREAPISGAVTALTLKVLEAKGDAVKIRAICSEAQIVYKKATDLKSFISQKRGLCVGQRAPNSELIDASVEAVREIVKPVCK